MLKAGKEYALPHVALKQQIFFFIRKIEGFLQIIDGRRRLFKQQLYRRVGDHRQSIGRLQKVVDVLGNGRQA